MPADRLVPVPDFIEDDTAAAVLLQGTTAHYLSRSTFPLDHTHTCLIHAAAGGIGGLLVQFAHHAGARVIGTVSTDEKARAVRALGADETILYTEQDFEAEVKRLTDGRGVDVVYDSVGRTTFDKSLNVLADERHDGALRPVERAGPSRSILPILNTRGSLFLTRPSLGHHQSTREELLWRAADVFAMIEDGTLKVPIRGPIRSRKQPARTRISRAGQPPASSC